MKKIFGFILCQATLFFCVSNLLAFQVPLDRDGVPAMSVQDTGVSVVSIRYSSSPSMVVTGSTIAIFGVLTSTKPDILVSGTSVWVELRSTNTANVSSELLLPPIVFSSTTRNTFIEFNPPVICPVGVSMNISTSLAFVSLFYRYLSTNTDEDLWIPIDERQGNKVYSSSFYGVKAASVVVVGAGMDTVGTDSLDFTSAERVVETQRGFMYGMMANDPPTGAYVVFEDTASSVGNPADFLPPIFYATWNYEDSLSSLKTVVIKFPWPIIFENGLNIAQDSAANGQFRVFTRPTRRLR